MISSQSFAARFNKGAGISHQITRGTVISIDKTKNLFTLQDSDDGKVFGFAALASDIASLNKGDHVDVTTQFPGGVIALNITQL